MRIKSLLGISAFIIGGFVLATTACGEDKGVVRDRIDSGTTEGGVIGEGGTGCGVAVPVNYVSDSFKTNAAVELGFAEDISHLDSAMSSTEGTSTSVAQASDLSALFNAGTPSLRSVATTEAQTLIDGYLTAYGAAGGKTWQPSDATADVVTTTGGKYQSLFYESPVGVDLRQAVDNALLGGVLYNHVLALVAAPLTAVTTDQLLGAYGATPAFADSTQVDAGADGDTLVAALASKRQDKSKTTGPYLDAKKALLTMKATIAAGDRCKADQTTAIADFELAWEKAIYASAIYALDQASTDAADSSKGALALHQFGAAIGLVESFKGVPADKRKITDQQIDTVYTTMLGDKPYEVVSNVGASILAIENAIGLIALYEGFTDDDVATFKQSF